MKVFRKVFDVEKRCCGCNWDTTVGFLIAENEKTAEEDFKNNDWMCAECLMDEIVNQNLPIGKYFCPEDFKDCIFIQWYDKEDISYFLKKKITDDEFSQLKEEVETTLTLPDSLSEDIQDQIKVMYESLKEEVKEI